MKFVRIEILFFIWMVPLLLLVFVYGMRKRSKILSGYATARGLGKIVSEDPVRRRWIKSLLMLLALLGMVFAMSGPQYGYRWQEVERQGIDIVIALDCSRSMLATDIKPSRLARAKREIFDLLNLLQGDRVGLVVFAGTAFLQCPLTLDYEAFYLFLDALTPDYLPIGGTNLAGAVNEALAAFNAGDKTEKAVILITDGESTGGDPIEAAQKAKDAGVKLFCIGVGKTDGAPVPDRQGGFKKDRTGSIVISKIDEDTLKKTAVLTGGTFVRSVAGDMDLETIYSREIRGKMERATLSSGRKQIWEDRFQWFLALALAALMFELFLPSIRQSTPMILLALTLLLHALPVQAAGVYQSLKKGREAYAGQDYEKALKFFIDAQLEAPDRPEIYYNIGNAYYKLGNYSAALENYEQALKSDRKPLKQKTLYNRGNTRYRMGRLKDAVSDYEAALKLDPDDRQAAQNIEFVKKVMEMKKQEKPESQDQQPEDGGQKSEDGGRHSEDGEQQPGDKSQQSEDNGQRPENRERQSEDGGQRPEDGSQQSEAGDQQSEDFGQKSEEGGQPGEQQDPEQAKQAERILNRLQDQPGRAMIPVYRERKVEKDW